MSHISIPSIGSALNEDHLNFLKVLTKSCRKSILEMVTNAQSGHPGGSLSSIDYLALIYGFILSQTGEKIVVSNGHISPAVYSILAEMGYIDREDVVKNFRKFGSDFEGHITRHVPGVWYGTGPLGVGVSVAAAFALGEKLKNSLGIEESSESKNSKLSSNSKIPKVFGLLGDGEAQEGQVHEMIHFAKHHKLDNLILFVDYNKVQLTAALDEIIDIDIKKTFEAGDFEVIETDAHNFQEMWEAIAKAYEVTGKPVVILGHSIMGQGVDFMEETGRENKADWHGKAPSPDAILDPLENLTLKSEEQELLENFRQNQVKWSPNKAEFPETGSPTSNLETKNPKIPKIDLGKPIRYSADEVIDCRSAYGQALLDLAKRNKEVVALTADLRGSVMTKFVAAELPDQHIECGIAEQHMVSAAGGLSLNGFIPFASTFGAFMTSRAKDQARVNDINYCNTKLVATHCGLSVGEDGPTHQAIDDKGSFLGFFNTQIIEPACPNQTDAIIRYVAGHYGNFYVRMGRHKFPIITKENGEIFYDENYEYQYGRSDIIREGSDLTIVASGACVYEALKAIESLKNLDSSSGSENSELLQHLSSEEIQKLSNLSIELIANSSIKKFDETLLSSIRKTKKVITVEDHNPDSGLGGQLARFIMGYNGKLSKSEESKTPENPKKIQLESFQMLGVTKYQLSGKSDELYKDAGIDAEGILKAIKKS